MDGVTTLYLRNGLGRTVDEVTGSAWTDSILVPGGERMAVVTGPADGAPGTTDTVNYLTADQVGTTRVITDQNGNNVATCGQDATYPQGSFFTFAPFGAELDCSQSLTDFKFTGKPRDTESGLDNFGARYNSSTLGRFMTPDGSDAPTPVPYASLASSQTLNLYAYSGSNPVSVVDLDGHLECYLDGAATSCGDAFNDVSTGSAGICPGTCSTFFNGQYYQYFFGAGTASGWEKFSDIAAGLSEWDGLLFTNDEMQQIEADRGVDQQVALAEYLWDHYRKRLVAKKLTTLTEVYDQLSVAKTVGGNTEFGVGTTLAGALTGLGLEIANGGSGCLMCRTGGRPSPHFDHGLLHLDNYRGGDGVFDSVMHVLVDVIAGQSLYGEVPFLRNSPGS